MGDRSTQHLERQIIKKMYKKEKKRRLRIWEPIGKWNIEDIKNNFTFKVVSYNVLAQHLLESQLFLFHSCLPEDLQWDVRSQRIYDEIVKLDPDILCLQEVQASHIQSFYSQFENIGYTGLYKKKTGSHQDGCAIYFKKELFHMEDYILVEFYKPSEELLSRDDVGLVVRLIPRDARAPPAPLIVATTRLHNFIRRDNIRLAQIQLFLTYVERFANNGLQLGYHPIILCGDMSASAFNPVIKLITKGNIFISKTMIRGTEIPDAEHPDVPDPTRPWYDDCTLPLVTELEHPLKFQSVYNYRKRNGSREATTFYRTSWNNFDYIFFSRDHRLRVLRRYRLPTEAECRRLYPIPNSKYGSNHFLLGALFELKAPTKN